MRPEGAVGFVTASQASFLTQQPAAESQPHIKLAGVSSPFL